MSSIGLGIFQRSRDQNVSPVVGNPRRRTRNGRVPTMSIMENRNPECYGIMKGLMDITTMLVPRIQRQRFRKLKLPHDSSTTASTLYGTVEMGDLSDDMHTRIADIYDDLKDGDPILSKEKFQAFLRDVQGEPDTPLPQDMYTPGDFLYTWKMFYSDAARPLPKKDLSKPLTNYFISSSHNTYQLGNQWTSKSSAEPYRRVLRSGCRCIEIDVWNDDAVTQTTSKSPRIEHQRAISGISGSSLPYLADTVHSYLGDSKPMSRSRSTSTNSRPAIELTPRESGQFQTDSKRDSLGPGPRGPKDSTDDLSERKGSRSPSRQRMPKGEPIVTHGWTLTAPCGFREVCEAIKESAFVDNDLPIIISLEVHADPERQEKMVEIMKEVWQEMLVTEPLEGCDPRFRVPKLEELRNRILIKVKRAPARMLAPQTINLPTPPDDDDSSDSDDEKPPPGPKKAASVPVGVTPPPTPELKQPSNAKVHICDALAELAVYTRSERFQGFDTPGARRPPHIFSVSERKILELNERQHEDIFKHNKSFFLRPFPAGRRVDSSNPDPSPFWRMGSQMVAMNWQKFDEGMLLNEGMFADEKGWVLKPETYRSLDKDHMTEAEASPKNIVELSVTVFSGQHIPLSSDSDDSSRRSSGDLHPLIKAELHITKAARTKDEGKYKPRTESAKSDQPTFGRNGSKLSFPSIQNVVQELSFLRIKIEDDGIVSSPMLACACIRLDRLGQGYRFIQLLDSKGNRIVGGKLFVKIQKTVR